MQLFCLFHLFIINTSNFIFLKENLFSLSLQLRRYCISSFKKSSHPRAKSQKSKKTPKKVKKNMKTQKNTENIRKFLFYCMHFIIIWTNNKNNDILYKTQKHKKHNENIRKI